VSELCTECRNPIIWMYHDWSGNPKSGEWVHTVPATNPHGAQGPPWCAYAGMSVLQCKAIDLCDCFDFPEMDKIVVSMSDEEIATIADLILGEP
jgi:hypothetical protein